MGRKAGSGTAWHMRPRERRWGQRFFRMRYGEAELHPEKWWGPIVLDAAQALPIRLGFL